MKQALCVCMTIIFLLSACGKSPVASADKWQEQYDLGARYLEAGNYEEAIIAFTAAIEIDPKQASAYVGRGNSHAGVAQLAATAVGAPEELPQDAKDAYESAIQDYLASLELAPNDPEVYLKTADAYVALGDTDAALDILNRGLAATGDQTIQERIDGLERPEDASETVSARGTIIYNPDVYFESFQPYLLQYDNQSEGVSCSMDYFGVRFETPVTFAWGGGTVTIQEAGFFPNNVIDTNSQLLDYSTGVVGPLIGPTLEMTGYFLPQAYGLEGPLEWDGPEYIYHPNGGYLFNLESYTVP